MREIIRSDKLINTLSKYANYFYGLLLLFWVVNLAFTASFWGFESELLLPIKQWYSQFVTFLIDYFSMKVIFLFWLAPFYMRFVLRTIISLIRFIRIELYPVQTFTKVGTSSVVNKYVTHHGSSESDYCLYHIVIKNPTKASAAKNNSVAFDVDWALYDAFNVGDTVQTKQREDVKTIFYAEFNYEITKQS